jgi:hypothetical protein
LVYQANAPVYALHHRVVDSVAVDAAGGGDPGDRLAVTAVEGKGDAYAPLSQPISNPSEHHRVSD